MKEVFIAEGVRTAIGSFSGSLSDVSSVELGRTVAKAKGRGKAKVVVDLFGLTVFLLPVIAYMTWLSWALFVGKLTTGMRPDDTVAAMGFLPYVYKLLVSGEVSSNAGGLIRWPAVLMLPLGFALVWLQGVAEIIKRVGWLCHRYNMDTHYERPLQ